MWPVVLQAVTAKMNRVRGELTDVQKQVAELIEDGDTEALCRELGLRSAGFLFLDVHQRVMRALANYRDDPSLAALVDVSRVVRTPYYWSSQNSARYEGLLHSLFYFVREWQDSEDISWDPNDRDFRVETEFLLYLPSVSACDIASDRAKEMDVHYCQVGDLWLTILLWRMACCARDAGFGESSLNELDDEFFDAPIASKACNWRGRDLLGHDHLARAPELVGLVDLWRGKACVGATWREEFTDLVTDNSVEGRLRSWRWQVALGMARQLGVPSDEAGPHVSQCSLLLSVAPKFVRSLVRDGVSVPEALTANHLIDFIERRSRFPVLPFFIWNVIEDQPVTYLVSPIWTSQQYPVKVLGADCQHIGLALCAVDVIPEFEPGDVRTLLAKEGEARREPSAAVLTSLLRVVARPLVEGSLYASGVMAARNEHDFLKRVGANEDDGSPPIQ